MRVLITGITGAAGSYLAEHIADVRPDVEIYGIARRVCERSYRLYSCYFGGPLDSPAVAGVALKLCKPTIIFNLAADANVRASWDRPADVFRNNTLATCNLLEAVRLHAPECKIVHCSTSEIYGTVAIEDTPITEEQTPNPVNPYAVSKWIQEVYCRIYSEDYGLNIVTTRAFGYINPRRRDLCASAFAKQVAECEAGARAVIRHGNLDAMRTFLDVRDVARAYWYAALECEPGEAYNIGSTEPVRVGDVLQMLMDEAILPEEKWMATQADPALMRPVDVTNQIPDVSKFGRATHFKPHYTLADSLAWLLDYYRGVVRDEQQDLQAAKAAC